jgi:2-polyprenyl-3-methyl-5-hydroxy-6-metoxy-1,4-benzoquinol methylase
MLKEKEKLEDYRKKFYGQYVSAFKKENSLQDKNSLRSYWAWCKYKYLPVLSGLKRNSAILELGCGPGYFLEFFADNGFTNIKGIDISEEQIQIARGRGFNAQVADVYSYIKSDEAKYDVVIALDLVEHFSKDELLQIFPSIYNALRSDGLLIIQTPNAEGLFPFQIIYGDITHLTVFTPASLEQLLSISGFISCEFYEGGPAPINIRGRVRQILWNLIKMAINAIRLIETGRTQKIWTESMICFCRKPAK